LAINWFNTRDIEKDDEEENRKQDLVAVLYNNMAVVCLKGNCFERARKKATQALKHARKPYDVCKANLNAARASRMMHDFKKAFDFIEAARVAEPYNQAVARELEEYTSAMKKSKVEENNLWKNMAQGVFVQKEDVGDRVVQDKEEEVRYFVSFSFNLNFFFFYVFDPYFLQAGHKIYFCFIHSYPSCQPK
jgi:hypothetical protein